MKRFFALPIIVVSLLLINGCSKCSREEVPPAPTTPAAEDSVLPAVPSDVDSPAESAPADDDSSSPNESVD